MTLSFYRNRWLVYSGLTILGGLMLIDAMPQYTLLHGKLKEKTDPILDVTGLWQGSWELFAPTPDHVNVRIWAFVIWKDRTQSIWRQPDWHNMSILEKGRNFRKMSWFDGLGRSSNSAAWESFARYLATEHSQKSFREVIEIRLFQDRDVIPPPDREWRVAYSVPKYSATSHFFTWAAND